MSELDAQRCRDLLLTALPEFGQRLAQYRATWSTGLPGLCNELGELASFVVELVEKGDTARLPSVFTAAEELLVKGTDDVKDAVATCLLEALQNLSSEKVARAWVPLLGEESRAYCEAWDEFTGAQTAGLNKER